MTSIASGAFADIGLTPELLAFAIIAFAIGSFLLAALIGGIAAIIVGPRRPAAAVAPGIAGGFVTLGIAMLVRLPPGVPWPVVAGAVTALFVAVLQRALLNAGAAPVIGALGSGWWMLGGAVTGGALGLVVGLVGAVLMHDGLVVPGLIVVGAVIGALGARPRREEPPAEPPAV